MRYNIEVTHLTLQSDLSSTEDLQNPLKLKHSIDMFSDFELLFLFVFLGLR